jgi:uncharacterized protein YneF (UPF0154 family)
LRGSKKSRMRTKVPSTTTLGFPTLSPLLTAGKNIVGYFLDRPRISEEKIQAMIAQSVQQRATGWIHRVRFPAGTKFFSSPQHPDWL